MMLLCMFYIGNPAASDLNFKLKVFKCQVCILTLWKKSRPDAIWEDNLNSIENVSEVASISKILPKMLPDWDGIKKKKKTHLGWISKPQMWVILFLYLLFLLQKQKHK